MYNCCDGYYACYTYDKISYDNYSRNVAHKKLTFLFITTVYLVLFRIEAP